MKKINYYFRISNRRKILDRLQFKYSNEYIGVVLDIGGKDKGSFIKPKDKVEKWLFADIVAENNPDIILDVADMQTIKSESIDVVNAIELFEHVENIDKGLAECYRVLKKNGKIIISIPFLAHIHADPNDFQRWTYTKWTKELEKLNFTIQSIDINGRFFTVLSEMVKTFTRQLPVVIRHIAYFNFPVLDFIARFDKLETVKNHKILGNFHGGYFIIAQK
jgi:SAM-dependent methyltransferase